jgi:hypothetical protein
MEHYKLLKRETRRFQWLIHNMTRPDEALENLLICLTFVNVMIACDDRKIRHEVIEELLAQGIVNVVRKIEKRADDESEMGQKLRVQIQEFKEALEEYESDKTTVNLE